MERGKKDNASLRIGSYSLEKVCKFAIIRWKKCKGSQLFVGKSVKVACLFV